MVIIQRMIKGAHEIKLTFIPEDALSTLARVMREKRDKEKFFHKMKVPKRSYLGDAVSI